MPPILSNLVAEAYGYDPEESIGYYRAHYELNMARNSHTEGLNSELTFEHGMLLLENLKLGRLAKEAVDMATNAVAPSVRHN